MSQRQSELRLPSVSQPGVLIVVFFTIPHVDDIVFHLYILVFISYTRIILNDNVCPN